MSHFTKFILVILIGLCHFFAYSQTSKTELLNQFSSELLALESKQILQSHKLFKYSDSENGTALRKLLSPDRAQVVVNAYIENALGGSKEPNVANQLKPLVERYQNAFDKGDKEYETEYLDGVYWSVLLIDASARIVSASSQVNVPTTNKEGKPLTTEERQMLESLQGMMTNMAKIMQGVKGTLAKSIRNDVAKGKFTLVGGKRALEIAHQISPLSTTN
jgi:hypothetical protein